ncbi:MAG: hypothetical protein R3D02_04360 [Hyphomicrobiales bacterium]
MEQKSGYDFWNIATPVTGLLFGFGVATQTEGFWPPVIAAFVGAGLVRGVQHLAVKNGAESGDTES